MKLGSDQFEIPTSEMDEFLEQPQAYVPGFDSHPAALKSIRGKNDAIKRAAWPGEQMKDGGRSPVNIDLRSPSFVSRAVAKAKGREPVYKVKVLPR
jgi:hypothetical protein